MYVVEFNKSWHVLRMVMMHFCDKNSIFILLITMLIQRLYLLPASRVAQYICTFNQMLHNIYLCLYTRTDMSISHVYSVCIVALCIPFVDLRYIVASLVSPSPYSFLHCKVDCYVYTNSILNPSFLLILIVPTDIHQSANAVHISHIYYYFYAGSRLL